MNLTVELVYFHQLNMVSIVIRSQLKTARHTCILLRIMSPHSMFRCRSKSFQQYASFSDGSSNRCVHARPSRKTFMHDIEQAPNDSPPLSPDKEEEDRTSIPHYNKKKPPITTTSPVRCDYQRISLQGILPLVPLSTPLLHCSTQRYQYYCGAGATLILHRSILSRCWGLMPSS